MPVADLGNRDQQIVLYCIRFILHSGRFELDDIEVRVGISEEELHRIERRWPEIDDRDHNGGGVSGGQKRTQRGMPRTGRAAGRRRDLVPSRDWIACIPDAHPGTSRGINQGVSNSSDRPIFSSTLKSSSRASIEQGVTMDTKV